MRFLRDIIVALVLVLAVVGTAQPAQFEAIELHTNTGVVAFDAELAITPEERARGLMGRADFGRGDAMLFIFPEPRRTAFWMEGTPVALDIIFFDSGGRWLNTAARTTPFSRESHPSAGATQFVLEIAGGEAARLGIGEGTKLIRGLDPQ